MTTLPRGRFTPLGDNLLVRSSAGDGPSCPVRREAWIGTVEVLSSSLGRAMIRCGDLIAVRSGAGDRLESGLVLVSIEDVLAIVNPSDEGGDVEIPDSSHPVSRGN